MEDRLLLAPFDKFYENCANGWRRVSERSLGVITRRLVAGRVLNPDCGWIPLLGGPSAEDLAGTDKGEKVCAVFDSIAKVVQMALRGASRTTRYMHLLDGHASFRDPDAALVRMTGAMKFRGRAFKDADTVFGGAKDTVVWRQRQGKLQSAVCASDIAMTIHWKAHDNTEVRMQNQCEARAAASLVLGNDRSRLYCFALTIERRRARLWHHTRSHSTVSLPFDIHEDFEELIQFIVFATFAAPHQLGLDTTVSRVQDADGVHQYQFEMEHTADGLLHSYQTTEVLCEKFVDESLYGRGMVVYAVRPATKGDGSSVDNDAPEFVLRDYWQKEARNEQNTQRELMSAMEERARTKEEALDMKDFFMTILAEATIAKDMTTRAYHHGEAPLWSPRVHYRVLYGERCKPLLEVKDGALYFHALAEGTRFLVYMKIAKHVHCDMSPGNIYVYRRPMFADVPEGEGDLAILYSVKVADFEFTSPYDNVPVRDSGVGTPPFMAVEVWARKHLFCTSSRPLRARHCFTFNYLHDLESMFWMALRFAMLHVSSAVRAQTAWEDLRPLLLLQRQYARRLFDRGHLDTDFRQEVMLGDKQELKLMLGMLKRAYGVDSMVPMLIKLIPALGNTYTNAENAEKLTAATKDEPFTRLSDESFNDTRELEEWADKAPASNKRKANAPGSNAPSDSKATTEVKRRRSKSRVR
ncbi:hypothetical protein HDZ31DRAFT_79275 [Schizophyllum fasciatum]